MFRKTLLVLAALALFCCTLVPAHSQTDRWEHISTSDDNEKCYLDTRSIRETAPDVYVFWYKLVPEDGPATTNQARIWCGKRQFQLLSPKKSPVYHIRPDTVIESLMEHLCAKG